MTQGELWFRNVYPVLSKQIAAESKVNSAKKLETLKFAASASQTAVVLLYAGLALYAGSKVLKLRA